MKYYRVTISGNRYQSTYSIKYSLTSSQSTYTLANLIYTSPPTASSGLSYEDMISNGGVEVEVPDGVYKLRVEDEAGFCNSVESDRLDITVSGSGANEYYLSSGFVNKGDNCGKPYLLENKVTSNASSIVLGASGTNYVYENNAIIEGGDNYYIVGTSRGVNRGITNSSFYYWKINNSGQITEVSLWNCSGSIEGGMGVEY